MAYRKFRFDNLEEETDQTVSVKWWMQGTHLIQDTPQSLQEQSKLNTACRSYANNQPEIILANQSGIAKLYVLSY